jgi:hypothetical protein
VLWSIVQVYFAFWMLGFAAAVVVHVANLAANWRPVPRGARPDGRQRARPNVLIE